MALRMSKTDRERFLAEPRVATVGIDEPDRPPRVVPLWYDFHPDVGVWVLTRKASRKTQLMFEAGRFSLCVQDDTPPAYRHVTVQGPITDTRECDLERDLRPMAHRYFGPLAGDAFIAQTPPESMLVFTMRPQRWITADYTGAFVLPDRVGS